MVLFVRWRLHGCDVCMLGMCWSVGRVSGVGLYAMVCIFAMDVASRDMSCHLRGRLVSHQMGE